jgi:hypothetical protein
VSVGFDDVIGAMLAAPCLECGELPEPGARCPSCGAVPVATRTEAERWLRAQPGAGALAEGTGGDPAWWLDADSRAEAKRLRDEAESLMARARERLAAADLVLHVARRAAASDNAAGELKTARGCVDQAAMALVPVAEAEQESAAALAAAGQAHRKASQDDEEAQRDGKGPQAEIDARLRLNAAAEIVQRYRAAHAPFAAARMRAEAVLASARADVTARERHLAAAVRAAAAPGKVPESEATTQLDPARQKDLALIAALSAMLQNDQQTWRLTEQDAEARRRMVLVGTGNGQMRATSLGSAPSPSYDAGHVTPPPAGLR